MNLKIKTDNKFLTHIDYDKELADYFNCSTEEISKKRKQAIFAKEWNARNIQNAEQANKLYAETYSNLFRQALPREKRLVLYRRILKNILTTQRHYEFNMDFSRHEYDGKRFPNYTMQNVLDYGCGIGDIGLVMTMLGYRTDLLEIGNSQLEKFIKWRFEKRYLPCNFIPYGTSIKGNYYDIIICVNVLEHHEKPREALMDMHHALRKYGYLFLAYGYYERKEDYKVLGDVNADEEFIKPFIEANFISKDKDNFWLIKK